MIIIIYETTCLGFILSFPFYTDLEFLIPETALFNITSGKPAAMCIPYDSSAHVEK